MILLRHIRQPNSDIVSLLRQAVLLMLLEKCWLPSSFQETSDQADSITREGPGVGLIAIVKNISDHPQSE